MTPSCGSPFASLSRSKLSLFVRGDVRMGLLCFGGDLLNERGLTVGVGYAVVWVGGGQSRHRSAAKVLDAPDECCRDTRAKMLRLASEQVGLAQVIGQDADILADGSLDALLNCVHFTRDALSRLTTQRRRPRDASIG